MVPVCAQAGGRLRCEGKQAGRRSSPPTAAQPHKHVPTPMVLLCGLKPHSLKELGGHGRRCGTSSSAASGAGPIPHGMVKHIGAGSEASTTSRMSAAAAGGLLTRHRRRAGADTGRRRRAACASEQRHRHNNRRRRYCTPKGPGDDGGNARWPDQPEIIAHSAEEGSFCARRARMAQPTSIWEANTVPKPIANAKSIQSAAPWQAPVRWQAPTRGWRLCHGWRRVSPGADPWQPPTPRQAQIHAGSCSLAQLLPLPEHDVP